MRLLSLASGTLLLLLPLCTTQAQSLKKQEARAINRSRHTVVNGDTVQLFTVAPDKRVHPRRNRVYYWYASEQVHHAQGDVNGRVLHGPYRLTTRAQQPLAKGAFHYGTKTGRWRTWHANGQVASVTRWHKGHPSGRPVYYEPDGTRRPKPAKVRRVRAAAAPAAASALDQPKRRRWFRRHRATAPAAPALPPVGAVPTEQPSPRDSATRQAKRAARKQQRAAQKAEKKKARKKVGETPADA